MDPPFAGLFLLAPVWELNLPKKNLLRENNSAHISGDKLTLLIALKMMLVASRKDQAARRKHASRRRMTMVDVAKSRI